MNPILYVNPELDQMRQLVAGARTQLAELEADYTKKKNPALTPCKPFCSGTCANIIKSATNYGSRWISGGSFWMRF